MRLALELRPYSPELCELAEASAKATAAIESPTTSAPAIGGTDSANAARSVPVTPASDGADAGTRPATAGSPSQSGLAAGQPVLPARQLVRPACRLELGQISRRSADILRHQSTDS